MKKMGTKQTIGDELTNRAGVEIRFGPIFHFPLLPLIPHSCSSL